MAAGVAKSRRLSAYSYRHSLREGMRAALIPDWLADRIGGWETEGTAAGYGASSSDRATMREAIEKAIPKLGEIPETEYTSDELVIAKKREESKP